MEGQIDYQVSNVTCLITIINYDEYNKVITQKRKQKDTKRTPNGHQTDTNNNENNANNENKKNIYGEFVALKDSEYEKLLEKLGLHLLDELIDDLNNYIGSTGKKYKSHYHTIRSWSKDRKAKAEKKSANQLRIEELKREAEQGAK
jgi:hypothetical protein